MIGRDAAIDFIGRVSDLAAFGGFVILIDRLAPVAWSTNVASLALAAVVSTLCFVVRISAWCHDVRQEKAQI